ncbi:MAG: PEP-CTERM sorting domain-containing protein [Verrucomicrobia bacterium]|nr:PEP-CTERM sorting domain-containing protein [Verrucomicrobiota bacterium]
MKVAFASLTLVLLAAGPLAAQNLVLNDSFELIVPGGGERGGPLSYRPNGGVPSPFEFWFATGDQTGVGTSMDPVPPRTGTASAIFGQVGAPGSIYQLIPTVAGGEYVVSFYVAVDNSESGPGTQTFAAAWDGANILFRNDTGFTGTSPYQFYTFTVTASSTLTRLEFFGQNDPAFYYLDDVSVISTVPEPGTWAAAALASGAMGGYIVRRRKRVS